LKVQGRHARAHSSGRSRRLAAGIFIGRLENKPPAAALGQHGLHGLLATGFTAWRTATGFAAAITTAASGTDLVGRTGWREITGRTAGSACSRFRLRLLHFGGHRLGKQRLCRLAALLRGPEKPSPRPPPAAAPLSLSMQELVALYLHGFQTVLTLKSFVMKR
jgi:hypothetical protein